MYQIIAFADNHCHLNILEKIIDKELSENPDTVAVLHCGDLGVYDIEKFECLPLREQHLIRKHENPVEQFKFYLDGKKQFRIPVYAIPGNHEDFDLVEEIKKESISIENLKIISPDECVRVSRMSFTVMGLGKIMPLGLSPKNKNQKKIIRPEEINALIKVSENISPTILLLHEAPYLVQKNSRTFGSPDITHIIKQIKPKMVITGHIHIEYRSQINNSQIYGLGYGVRGRYAIIDEELNVTFKSYCKEQFKVHSLMPGDTTQVAGNQESVRKQPKRKPRLLTAKKMIEHFNLQGEISVLRKQLAVISRKIYEMQVKGKLKNKEDALKIAEEYLKNKVKDIVKDLPPN